MVLYYVVGIDFNGVVRGKAVNRGSGGGMGVCVGRCGERGGDPVDYMGFRVYDKRVFRLLRSG
jgi:hypothetical protein